LNPVGRDHSAQIRHVPRPPARCPSFLMERECLEAIQQLHRAFPLADQHLEMLPQPRANRCRSADPRWAVVPRLAVARHSAMELCLTPIRAEGPRPAAAPRSAAVLRSVAAQRSGAVLRSVVAQRSAVVPRSVADLRSVAVPRPAAVQRSEAAPRLAVVLRSVAVLRSAVAPRSVVVPRSAMGSH
jgi:hypothetical protein